MRSDTQFVYIEMTMSSSPVNVCSRGEGDLRRLETK